MRPFAVAFLLMLLFGAVAMAQQPANPPLTDDQTNNLGLLGGVGGCVCVLIFIAVILAINIAILVWVYKDAQGAGPNRCCGSSLSSSPGWSDSLSGSSCVRR